MFMTYEAMTKYVSNGNAVSPTGIVFDESSKLKTKNSKRTIAAMSAALTILHEDGYIILMSGTPAPKSPMDWWSQTEIACPGYLVESSPDTMKYTMAYITEESGPGDSKFPKLVGWKNTTLRCDVCGEFGSHMLHTCYEEPNAVKMAIIKDPSNVELRVKLQRIENTRMGLSGMHDFREGKNEVARLYKRLQGMSLTVFKKDCVDLPDKFYREIDCKPPRDLLQAAKALVGIEKKGAALRMKLRQLSDGFLYKEREIGRSKCMACEGKGSVDFWWSDQLDCAVPEGTDNAVFKQDQTCVHCGGDCTLPVMEPYTDPLPNSPKEEALGELFDEYEDIGRMVIFAAFTASIDKITALAVDKGWHYVRVDGRGWTNTLDTDDRAELLGLFQEVSKDSSPDKLVFIMHPESGGMGLTLTASPVAIFYSNDDKAENRFQAEDRIHRIGMDTAKGATIIDLFCLETDRLILSSLRNKKDLQSITLGDMTSCLENQIREV
jgi:SNF2 family DNA or RNA helicase